MQEKAGKNRPQKDGGKKRKLQPDDVEGAESRKKGHHEREDDGAKKHLDPLSVGYFRRVGERLGEAFEGDEERGEKQNTLTMGTGS